MTPHILNVAADPVSGLPAQINLRDNTITYTEKDGRLVKMDLGPADVHIDSALANYAAGYRFADVGLVADECCPAVPVAKASDYYYTWDKDDVFQDVSEADLTSAGAGATPKEISPRLSSTTYSTIGRSLGAFVSTEEIANADAPLQVEQMAVARILTAFRAAREIRVASLLTTSGNWTGGYVRALAAGEKWNGGASSDPVEVIHTLQESSLTPVNMICMSERVAHSFMRNAQVQKYVASKTQVKPAVATENANDFAAILGLPRFCVATRKHKTSASAYGYIWGNSIVGCWIEPGMPMRGETISTAKTFRWTQANTGVPDGTIQGGFLVRSYFDPRRGARGGRVVVVACNDTEKMTSVYAGGLVTGAYA